MDFLGTNVFNLGKGRRGLGGADSAHCGPRNAKTSGGLASAAFASSRRVWRYLDMLWHVVTCWFRHSFSCFVGLDADRKQRVFATFVLWKWRDWQWKPVAAHEAWTIHLYEAFFFGCVPVILSDDLTVPLQVWAAEWGAQFCANFFRSQAKWSKMV